ncbi:MAG: hypothetical protein APF84_07680 [Gracilibacter sp. BRH_c7a]|nr:MAG: hypothetical protein APF84_19185 [Gracilibacter sp. BRH_c7a]KUO65106.1 MAG: hypothetical protein APF84_07680 [Gracilibacter sp. BRH_c7a]
MPRPVKWRKVEFIPESKYFVPCPKGKCANNKEVQDIQLKVEELEAMRLKDIEELHQEECAERMMVSRQTFQNIIDEARKKVVTALIEGKAISVGGGHYTKHICKFRCPSCGDKNEMKFEERTKTCRCCGAEGLVCNKNECLDECKDECE